MKFRQQNRLTPLEQIGAGFSKHASITPNDSIVVEFDALYAGGEGDLVIEDSEGTEVTYTGFVGWILLRITKVKTATTATNLVGLNY